MSIPAAQSRPPSTATLRRTFNNFAATGLASVSSISRSPWPYFSSFPIEELTVGLSDGLKRRLLFKDLSPASILPGARRIKTTFDFEPRREIEVYRTMLAPHAISSPTYLGSVSDSATGRYWLFLEKIDGSPLCHVGEFETWCAAVQWLAALHARFADSAANLVNRLPLAKYDASWAGKLLDRLQPNTDSSANSADRRDLLRRVLKARDVIVNKIRGSPTTFVHGEFYASNVMIDPSAHPSIRPVDWEMAGIGPGALDLAALTAGNWTEPQRATLADVYLRAAAPAGPDFAATFAACRLLVAVQWIGCSEHWSPPDPHRTNWFAEARAAAQHLGLL